MSWGAIKRPAEPGSCGEKRGAFLGTRGQPACVSWLVGRPRTHTSPGTRHRPHPRAPLRLTQTHTFRGPWKIGGGGWACFLPTSQSPGLARDALEVGRVHPCSPPLSHTHTHTPPPANSAIQGGAALGRIIHTCQKPALRRLKGPPHGPGGVKCCLTPPSASRVG